MITDITTYEIQSIDIQLSPPNPYYCIQYSYNYNYPESWEKPNIDTITYDKTTLTYEPLHLMIQQYLIHNDKKLALLNCRSKWVMIKIVSYLIMNDKLKELIIE